MASTLTHLTDMLRYAATRPDHDRKDRATAASLTTPTTEWGLPAGLTIDWLGVAGFALRYESTTVLIDPYVTRAPVSDLLRRRVVRPDRSVIDRWVPRADAILVGHTHFDHALDVPAIALRDDCPVYGGASCRHLMHLWDLDARARPVEPHRPFEVGPFTITFVPSVHSRLILGLRTPSDGELTCEHLDGLTTSAYRCGEVWGIHIEVAGTTIYHQGSANLIDDEVRHRDVDVFLCGIAGRQVTDRYLPRILGRLGPRLVVATHYDDFLTPVERVDERFAFGVDVDRFPDEVAAVSQEFTVVAPEAPGPLSAASRPHSAGTIEPDEVDDRFP